MRRRVTPIPPARTYRLEKTLARERDGLVRASVRMLAASIIVLAFVHVGAPGAVGGPPSLGVAALDDPEGDCLEPVPESVGVSGISDDGQEVKLEVMVLLDRMPKARAGKVMDRAAATYAALDIELVVTRYRRITVPGEPPRPQGKRPTVQDTALFDAMKGAVGGKRPEDTDLVHLLTSKDVYYVDQGERRYGLAGVADCIGGVRYDAHAFSFSEGIGEYDAIRDDMAGVIAAHEIGHLMGAHHHYGNCAQGSPPIQDSETPCTVMFPLMIAWNAGNFGTLEAAVVRGHAVDFASP